MQESMNQPYVKQFDSNGTLLNPIKGMYLNESPNRKERREIFNKPRFKGNGKNISLTIMPIGKFLRIRQVAKCKDGSINTIEHYELRPQ